MTDLQWAVWSVLLVVTAAVVFVQVRLTQLALKLGRAVLVLHGAMAEHQRRMAEMESVLQTAAQRMRTAALNAAVIAAQQGAADADGARRLN